MGVYGNRSGGRLNVLAFVLVAGALAGAIGVAVSGDLRPPPGEVSMRGSIPAPDPAAVSVEIGRALEAESAGDVAAALAHYRAAALLDPRIVDARSREFLGPAFEGRLKGWIAGLKAGTVPGGGKALSDASFLFRRMYGGCG
jgi:hypothetical protein